MNESAHDFFVVSADQVVLPAWPVDGDVDVIDEFLEPLDVLSGDPRCIGRENDFLESVPSILEYIPEPLVEHWLAARKDDAAHAVELVDHRDHLVVGTGADAWRLGAVHAAQVTSPRKLKCQAQRDVHGIDEILDALRPEVLEVLKFVVENDGGE